MVGSGRDRRLWGTPGAFSAILGGRANCTGAFWAA